MLGVFCIVVLLCVQVNARRFNDESASEESQEIEEARRYHNQDTASVFCQNDCKNNALNCQNQCIAQFDAATSFLNGRSRHHRRSRNDLNGCEADCASQASTCLGAC